MWPGTWMTSCLERRAEDFGIWKKAEVEIQVKRKLVDFWSSPRRDQLGVYELCRSWWVSDEKVSIDKINCVSLSSCRKNFNSKSNKKFRTWTNFVFSNFLCLFHISVSWSHFWTWIFYIRIHIYAETWSTIMTNEHTSLEKYTSHTLCERVVCEMWVGDWTDCNILTPSSSDYSSTSFLILLDCSTGGPECPSPLLGAGSHCLELQL